MIHQPWRTEFVFTEDNWRENLMTFLWKDWCPLSLKTEYDRAMFRHYAKLTHHEQKAKKVQIDNNMTEESRELLQLSHLHDNDYDDDTGYKFDFGETFQWDQNKDVSIRVF